MFVITDKETHAIYDICGNMRTDFDGFPVNEDRNIKYIPWTVDVFSAEEIPEEVEQIKFCYTPEEGFYPNPNYREPDPFDSPEYAAGYEQALLDLMELEFEEEE